MVESPSVPGWGSAAAEGGFPGTPFWATIATRWSEFLSGGLRFLWAGWFAALNLLPFACLPAGGARDGSLPSCCKRTFEVKKFRRRGRQGAVRWKWRWLRKGRYAGEKTEGLALRAADPKFGSKDLMMVPLKGD